MLMRKQRCAVAGIAAVLLACCAAAPFASGDPVRQTVTLATIRHSARFPGLRSTVVYAGTVSGTLGRGTIVDRITITGHPTSTTFRFNGSSTGFYAHGAVTARITGAVTVGSRASVRLAGNGSYTGGTDSYRQEHGGYSFAGTAPAFPAAPQPSPCAVPAGSKVLASDPQVVVISAPLSTGIEQYRYCDYADPARGFRLLAQNDPGAALGGSTTLTTVDGVALSDVLYHSGATTDSPACGGVYIAQPTVSLLDTSSDKTQELWQGQGTIESIVIAPTGVAAWLVNDSPCEPAVPQPARHESLQVFAPGTGAVATLDTGDGNETEGTPLTLANLELYPCFAGCSTRTTIVAWSHDGTQRYAQVG